VRIRFSLSNKGHPQCAYQKLQWYKLGEYMNIIHNERLLSSLAECCGKKNFLILNFKKVQIWDLSLLIKSSICTNIVINVFKYFLLLFLLLIL